MPVVNDHADPRFDPDATLLSARATATPSARANATPSARTNATPSAPVTATSVASEIAGRMRGRASRARIAMGLRGILLLALCIGGGFGFLHAPTLFARERDARMASPTHPPPYPRAALDAETEASHKDREQRDAIRQRIAAHAEGKMQNVE